MMTLLHSASSRCQKIYLLINNDLM